MAFNFNLNAIRNQRIYVPIDPDLIGPREPFPKLNPKDQAKVDAQLAAFENYRNASTPKSRERAWKAYQETLETTNDKSASSASIEENKTAIKTANDKPTPSTEDAEKTTRSVKAEARSYKRMQRKKKRDQINKVGTDTLKTLK